MKNPAASIDSHSPIITHRCYRPGREACDDPGANSNSWPCHKASCNCCVDLNWNLYCHQSYAHGLPLPYNQIYTTFGNLTLSAERGCQICSLLCEGITAVSKSLIDKDAAYSEMLTKSMLEIELRHNGPVVVSLYAHDDEDLLVQFYTRRGTPANFQIFLGGDTSTILTTTKDTITQRCRDISFSELPRTFQDAVQITRALGCRYLWIDSLCIIQDDKDDWQFESAKMAEIYLESCLTIAATASVDSTGGFFFDRWTSRPGGLKVNIETFEFHRTFNGMDYTVYVRQGLDGGHQRMSRFPISSINTAPLLQRAWAYQERMLAPRMLHVHMEEMFWECKSCTICECGHLSWEREHLDNTKWTPVGDTLSLKGSIAQAVGEATPVEDVREMWLDVVEEYSSLAITKESDRLPALSGLAKFLSSKVQTSYLAGLWESNFAIGLLWRRCSVLNTSCYRDKTSNVPSWSWASIVRTHQSAQDSNRLNHITYNEVCEGITQDPRLKILNAACIATGTNPFGEVSGGTVSIEGALIIAKYASLIHLARPQVLFGIEASGVYTDIRGPGEPAEV